jgi:hypothetical protein
MVLAVGAVQVALALYGRNVVASTAHEAARAGVERGATASDAEDLAVSTATKAGGRLIRGLAVSAAAADRLRTRTVEVRITGTIDVLGPLPIPVPVDVTARASTESIVE